MLANATAMASLPAHNLARAIAFYRDKLGLRPQQQMQGSALYQCGGSWFLVYETQFAGTAQNTAMGFMVEDVEAEVTALKGAGVVFEDYDFPGLKTVNGIAEFDGNKSAWFKDSEGNIIAINQAIA